MTTDPTTTAPGDGESRAASLRMSAAAIVAGVAGLLLQLVAANRLPPADNARFLVFWGLVFGVVGALSGMQNELTRSVRVRAHGHGAQGPAALAVGLLTGAGIGAALALTSPLWGPAIFGDGWAAPAALTSGGIVLFGGSLAIQGAAAGIGRWTECATVNGGEGLLRLLLVIGAGAAGWGVGGFKAATVLAAATWVALLLPLGGLRQAARARTDRPLAPLLRAAALSIGATAAFSLLVNGYSVLLAATIPTDVLATSAPVMLAVSLTRATLMFPVISLQGVLVVRVAADPARTIPTLVKVGAALVALALVGGAAAWAIGPWLLDVLAPGYAVPGPFLFVLMLGAGSLTLTVLTGAVCVATERRAAYALGWWLALLGGVVLLLLPLDLMTRVGLSLVIGPLVGAAVHLAAIARTGPGTVSGG